MISPHAPARVPCFTPLLLRLSRDEVHEVEAHFFEYLSYTVAFVAIDRYLCFEES